MAEQLLHRADVVALFQQVGGKRVAEGVASRRLGNPGAADGIRHRALENGFVKVVTTALSGEAVHVHARGGEDPLPAPVPAGVRVLPRQCIGQLNPAGAAPEVDSRLRTKSGAARAPEARRDARLVVVAVWMQQRRLGENPRTRPAAGPELREPLDTGGDRVLRADDAPDALARYRRLEVAPAQCLDDRERPDARRIPVAAQCLEVDPRAELVHLRVAHAGPDVATRDRETLEPSVVQHLRSVGEEPVDGYVFDARRVPEEPRDGVYTRMGPSAQMRLGQLGEESIDEARVQVPVAAQEEGDGVHRGYGLSHTFMNVLLS